MYVVYADYAADGFFLFWKGRDGMGWGVTGDKMAASPLLLGIVSLLEQ